MQLPLFHHHYNLEFIFALAVIAIPAVRTITIARTKDFFIVTLLSTWFPDVRSFFACIPKRNGLLLSFREAPTFPAIFRLCILFVNKKTKKLS
jgi:hypothetical protein